jgi:hypothetical protein
MACVTVDNFLNASLLVACFLGGFEGRHSTIVCTINDAMLACFKQVVTKDGIRNALHVAPFNWAVKRSALEERAHYGVHWLKCLKRSFALLALATVALGVLARLADQLMAAATVLGFYSNVVAVLADGSANEHGVESRVLFCDLRLD